MLRKFFFLGLTAVAAGAAGCKKDTLPAPPPCYTGRVVAVTCMDGLLLDVDPAYPIGAPAVLARGRDTLVGRNVIAAVNIFSIGRLATVGQILHFNYVVGPAQHSEVTCLAFDGSKTPIPRGAVSNVSTTACDSIAP